MATGKTNSRFINVLLDDVGGVNRVITASVSDISGVGLDFATTDVTSYSDGVLNFTLGHPASEIDISGPFSNVADIGGHVVFAGIINNPQTQTSYTLTVQIGIRGVAASTNPEFEGLYFVTSYLVSGDGTYTAHLVPATATAPAWGTVA